jgi:glycosyltransferase involved in cell wall biosynthesis
MAREIARVTTLDIQVESWSKDRRAALQRMASARIAIGIGISEGIGTSFLEAMALGAFPIAATTACACEWVRNGVDGLIVNPHDIGALAEAITRAASDDALVDAASLRNRRVVEQRWDIHVNREPALRMYRDTMEIVHERPRRSRHHA